MRAIYFALLIFGLLTAAVVDVGGGSGSHQVIVKTGETTTIVNVSDSAGIGFVNEQGEEVVVESGGGMPSPGQQVQAQEMVVSMEQNRVVISDSGASAEVKTELKYQEQAVVSTQSNKEIKVAPSVAVEAIPADAQIKNIELTDDGTAPTYEVSAISNGRIFFVLPVEMEVIYKIDATNGRVIAEEKPWWGFLVWS